MKRDGVEDLKERDEQKLENKDVSSQSSDKLEKKGQY